MNFLNFLGSSTSSASSFMCPNCKKRTPHNRITIAEWSAINDPSNGGVLLGAALDVLQITRIAPEGKLSKNLGRAATIAKIIKHLS